MPSGAARRAASVIAAAATIAVLSGCVSGSVSPAAVVGSPTERTSPTAVPSSSGFVRPSRRACTPTDPATDVFWWNDRVFYEVFVRSFQDSDGDGVGDLRGLTERLDYLNDGDPDTTDDLGVTGLWLMPVAESASYHGYDVVDYRAIERDYGTAEDFRALVAAAHARGIAVIVDLVLNHTSIQHPWFKESRAPGSRKDDWYIWSDADPGYGGPDGQPVWHAESERFYYAQFGAAMPDLNLTNPVVTGELEDVARQWLTDFGVDGFRLDAVKHLVEEGRKQANTTASHAWLAAFQDHVEAVKLDALLVGEVFDPTVVSATYVPDAVDLTFDFELASQTVYALRLGDASAIAAPQRNVLERYPAHQYAAFLTNHDQPRVMSDLRDAGAARAAASLLLTNPGVPFVYYGEEIGMSGGKPDERIRSPMPWNASDPRAGFTTGTPWEPLEEGWQDANVDAQSRSQRSLLAHYRSLIALRAEHAALRIGQFVRLPSQAPEVYAFLTTFSKEIVAVVVNVGRKEVTDFSLSLEDVAVCLGATASLLYSDGVADGSGAAPAIAPVGASSTSWSPVPTLPARSTLIISLDR
jgi:alpha-amylase